MSVLLETSLGDIVVDLFTTKCPITTLNFIKLCQAKFYNNSLFYNVEKDFWARVRHADEVHRPTSIYGYGISRSHF
jgi:cyclophilin family peptidyl-prolyl cis-trans isomerase